MDGRGREMTTKGEKRLAYMVLALPAVIIYLAVVAFPTIFSVLLSSTDYNGGPIFGPGSNIQFAGHNTRWAVLIPYIALGLPMGVYLCTDFQKSIPDELLEAARIDGASFISIFSRVVLPMCAPVSVTLAIITFTGNWNEFILMSLMTSSEKLKAIPYMVGRYAGALGSDYGKLFTSLTVALIPILIFYSIFRNQITKGVAAGAVKG